MKKVGLLVLIMLGFAEICIIAEDYSKMSAHELDEALIAAVKKGSYDEVQKLLKEGANPDQNITYTKSNYDDYDTVITCTLLAYAAQCGYTDIVKEFVRIKLAKRGYMDIIKGFVGIRTKDDDIDEALILAAKKGHVGVVKELVRARPTVDALNIALISAAENFPGITANPSSGSRYRIALKDYLPVIKELINAGADVNYVDGFGNTALIEVIGSDLYTEAQKGDRAKIIEVFLKAC